MEQESDWVEVSFKPVCLEYARLRPSLHCARNKPRVVLPDGSVICQKCAIILEGVKPIPPLPLNPFAGRLCFMIYRQKFFIQNELTERKNHRCFTRRIVTDIKRSYPASG